MSVLGDAYATFLLGLMARRPRELDLENSDDDLEARVCEIDEVIILCKSYLKVLVEDTAQHVALAKRPDDIVENFMTDMAGDLHGHLLQAIERNAA